MKIEISPDNFLAMWLFVIFITAALLGGMNAILLLSVMINIALIAVNTGAVVLETESDPITLPTPEPFNVQSSMYGPQFDNWQMQKMGYSSCYDNPKPHAFASSAENTYSIDQSNVILAQKRARDKKCSDGWLSKDANYYKYHYGGELDQAENRVWWGQSEY